MTSRTGGPRRPHEPRWCALIEHAPFASRHRSEVAQVGPRPAHRGRGQAAAWVEQHGDGPPAIAVQAAHMTSCTVELSPKDAAAFRDALTRLLQLLGWER